MKKKISFKLIAVVLALVICLVPMFTVLASAKPVKVGPIVNVHGLMASDIYNDVNNPDAGLAWPPSNDAILDTVKGAIPALAKFAATQDWETFGEDVCVVANKLFEPVVCNPDGTANGNTGVIFKYPSAKEINSTDHVNFRYDWRIDPIVVAEQLDKFINYVLECSGSDKVPICCHSLGGVITNTYLTIYGDSKISGVCFNSTAVFGQTYIGELMTGQIVFDSDSLQWFLSYVIDYLEYKNLLNSVIDIIRQAGLMDVVTDMCNTVVDKLLAKVSVDVLAPIFGRWLSIWAMTRDQDIEAAEESMMQYLGQVQDTTALKAKIDNFNTVIRPYKEQTLRKLNEDANVYVISRYGYCSIPITPSFDVNSDGVVDTASTSFGATVAPYNQTLSDEYIAGVDAKYISPDKTVDASTCMFPEQTWFIRSMQHPNNPDSLDEMMYTFLQQEEQVTVDTYAKYPRFCTYDPANDVIFPDTDYAQLTFFDRIVLVFKDIVNLIKLLVSKIAAK